MSYANQVLCAEIQRLRKKALLKRLSASNQSETRRGQKCAQRYIAEAERCEALMDDLLGALRSLDPLLAEATAAAVARPLKPLAGGATSDSYFGEDSSP